MPHDDRLHFRSCACNLSAGRCRAVRRAGPVPPVRLRSSGEAARESAARPLAELQARPHQRAVARRHAGSAGRQQSAADGGRPDRAGTPARAPHRTHAQRGAGRAARRRRLRHAAEHSAREPRRGRPELPGPAGQPAAVWSPPRAGTPRKPLPPIEEIMSPGAFRSDGRFDTRAADHAGRSAPRRAALRHIHHVPGVGSRQPAARQPDDRGRRDRDLHRAAARPGAVAHAPSAPAHRRRRGHGRR